MEDIAKLTISNIKSSPGSTAGDKLIATNSTLLLKITFEADTQPALDKLTFKLKSLTIGSVDKIKVAQLSKESAFNATLDGSVYKVDGYCSINSKTIAPLSFNDDITFSFAMSLDNGVTWEPDVTCTITVINNTGIDLSACIPAFVKSNTAIDTAPIDDTARPTATNVPVSVQFKALDNTSKPVAKAYITIALTSDTDITTLLNTNRKARFFTMNSDGSIGDEIHFKKKGFSIVATIQTDALGLAYISCYATQHLLATNRILNLSAGLLFLSGSVVWTKEKAILLTTLDFPQIDYQPGINGQQGNDVHYDSSKTGLKILIPEYDDYTFVDSILVINKAYNTSDNTAKICADTVINTIDFFDKYTIDVSYLDVVPNTWNEMRFITWNKDNIKISVSNLWNFISPPVIDIDPPIVPVTEPVPDLIFTSEEGAKYHIGKDFNYSLNSSCINYGGKLELVVTFDPTHVTKNDVITVSYGIKAFKESTGIRQPNYAKNTLSEPTAGAWTLTDQDITAKKKTIELLQSTFIGFDGDENGKNGTMWMMANIGLSCHSAVLYAEIDTVGAGE